MDYRGDEAGEADRRRTQRVGVREEITAAAREAGVPLEIRADRHSPCTGEEFAAHAEGRKQLRMEYFCREMRVKAACSWTATNSRAASGTSTATSQ